MNKLSDFRYFQFNLTSISKAYNYLVNPSCLFANFSSQSRNLEPLYYSPAEAANGIFQPSKTNARST